jgi:dGTPase
MFVEKYHKEQPDPDDIRSAFQHDKDRILHSTAFRRLQYKTQVYMIHEGDLYRTRLTHTLDVAQIAVGLARLLKVNCDLAEAIALAHDVGHTPFGHAGEDKLRDLLKPFCIPFNHNIQSYRVLSKLEDRYTEFRGLNLTHAVREGILRHNSFFDEQKQIERSITDDIKHDVAVFWSNPQPGIEAQIVSIADAIAYAAHDIEDALATGLIAWDNFGKKAKENNIKFIGDLMCEVEEKVSNTECGEQWVLKIRPRILARLMIDKLIKETVKQTTGNIDRLSSFDKKLYEQIRELKDEVVALPKLLEEQVRVLVIEILLNEVYKEPRVMLMEEKAKLMLDFLFKIFMNEQRALPKNTQARLRWHKKRVDKDDSELPEDKILPTVVADYISGMTDKYAMDLYQLLSQPYEKVL